MTGTSSDQIALAQEGGSRVYNVTEQTMRVVISDPSKYTEHTDPATGTKVRYSVGTFSSDWKGQITDETFRTHQVELLDQFSNLIPLPLLVGHIYDNQGHKITGESAQRLARKILREQGLPEKIWAEKVSKGTFKDEKDNNKRKNRYQCQGEEMMQSTPAGPRMQYAQYKNPVAAGAHKGDYQVIFSDAVYYAQRKKNDPLSTVNAIENMWAMKDEFGTVHKPIVCVTSTSNVSHSSTFIDDREKKWGTANKRLAGRVGESVNKEIPEILVTFENGCQLNAQVVLQHLPNSPEALKLKNGPNEFNAHIKINVQNVHGNNWDSIEDVHADQTNHLRTMAAGNQVYTGSWADTYINDKGLRALTKDASSERFNKYENDVRTRVFFKGAMVPLDHEAFVKATEGMKPEERMAAYPPASFMVAAIKENGANRGSQRVLASYGRDSENLPEQSFNEVTAFYKGQTHERAPVAFAERVSIAAPARNGNLAESSADQPTVSQTKVEAKSEDDHMSVEAKPEDDHMSVEAKSEDGYMSDVSTDSHTQVPHAMQAGMGSFSVSPPSPNAARASLNQRPPRGNDGMDIT
jgi:hypothetical protein